MKISRSIEVQASRERVWQLIATEYDQVDRWASAVAVSKAIHGNKINKSAPFAGRTCETSLGPFTESIVEYDESEFAISYEATGAKMPFFVKRMLARWTLTSLSTASTKVDMTLEVTLLPFFNIVMVIPMKMQLGKVLTESTEELKHYAETGRAHPRKVALASAAV